jgi:hypothetical protein
MPRRRRRRAASRSCSASRLSSIRSSIASVADMSEVYHRLSKLGSVWKVGLIGPDQITVATSGDARPRTLPQEQRIALHRQYLGPHLLLGCSWWAWVTGPARAERARPNRPAGLASPGPGAPRPLWSCEGAGCRAGWALPEGLSPTRGCRWRHATRPASRALAGRSRGAGAPCEPARSAAADPRPGGHRPPASCLLGWAAVASA